MDFGESVMRFLFGMVIGAVLTVGAAYVSDNVIRTDAPSAAGQQQMVNWDVVGKNWNRLADRVRREWTRLSAG
jgi:hypothetical protein